ncbi:hypothetical protein ACFL6R_03430 [Gemmatimonadota bacterium]
MTISEALRNVTTIIIGEGGEPVLRSAAELVAGATGVTDGTDATSGAGATIEVHPDPGTLTDREGTFLIFDPVTDPPPVDSGWESPWEGEAGVRFTLREDGSGAVIPSDRCYLYGFLAHLLRHAGARPLEEVEGGRYFPVSFAWNRTVYDFFLNQEGRIQQGLDRESYIERLSASGFTHLEVNGLAAPRGLETGPPGEIYPMFYTYCPALDQFTSSTLNEGLYPDEWLAANLDRLKEKARFVSARGLVPGLLCFEPRSVPEEFFSKHPMLRGARVDHPFRSFKPRYNMTITHPLVREHYAEMVDNLLREVPELGFLTIWTNDSGAGFEYTKSLYVGRNGGAYLIREWKDDEEIARAAGENALLFFRTLRDAGRERNPDFRVITRMESFYGEHDTIWAGLEEGIDVETTSLVGRGWEMPYTHPRYPDSRSINGGTVYQLAFDDRERELMIELKERSSEPHFYFAAGPNSMFAPLVGIPSPRLTWQRLALLHRGGVDNLAHTGGTAPPEIVPFNINHEVVSLFQFDPEADLEPELRRIAAGWAGGKRAESLLVAWRLAEEAILAFPNITPLYSTFGFVWYRLWARPFVPDIEAIPEEERAYYQDWMCTTPHNPNNVDLSRDVLFRLTTPEQCERDLERIEANLWDPLDGALELLEGIRSRTGSQSGTGDAVDGGGNGDGGRSDDGGGQDREGDPGQVDVIEDQYVRLSALRCWFVTQRNVAAWVAGVYGYMDARQREDTERMSVCRALLDSMIDNEIANSRRLLELLDSGVEFMATTDLEETQLIHGRNLDDLLRKRIALMEAHRGDEPFIDPDYIERQAGRESPTGSEGPELR